MAKNILILMLALLAMTSCKRFNALEKSNDYEYKYEVAKQYFFEGKYVKASLMFGELLAVMKGTLNGEESLYMLAMSSFLCRDYENASQYFRKYYQSYPKGQYVEYARYYAGYSLYKKAPDPRLDQSNTYQAIHEFQQFLDYYPYTRIKNETHQMIYALQDRLIEKEYMSAKLYYDLGTYIGNCTSGGSNYEACVVTSQNALRDFPYASNEMREKFAILILRSKYHLAMKSVEEKKEQRFRDAIDEFYSFVGDYPESQYMAEAVKMHEHAEKMVAKKNFDIKKSTD
ncbi:MAG: outer membrane protein assembly factor BamD [Bacteroidaceae bacterium]|nr:outer membrane protein assembly factor BamD [Bacteroidaceae bacterium]